MKSNQRGHILSDMTLIEWMLMMAIIGILVAVAWPGYEKYKWLRDHPGEIQVKTSPITRNYNLECIDGQIFIMGRNGNFTTKLDENGRPKTC